MDSWDKVVSILVNVGPWLLITVFVLMVYLNVRFLQKQIKKERRSGNERRR